MSKIKIKIIILKEILFHDLILVLELESANAILKMGVFTSVVIDRSVSSSDNFINKFIIFIMGISIRIAINQYLGRFHKKTI